MPTIPEAIQSALQHHQAGRLTEAEALYRQILQAQPDHPDAIHLLGVIAHQVGRHDLAVDYIARAIALNARSPEFHYNIGEAYRAQGRLDEAGTHFRQALALRPNYVDAQTNLAMVMHGQGRRAEALTILFDGLAAQPTNAHLRGMLASSLHGVMLHAAGESVRAILLSLCHDDDISTQSLAGAIIGLVKHAPAFPALLKAMQSGADPFASAAAETEALTREPLLLAALPRMVVCDAELEQVLAHVRRWVLLRAEAHAGLAAADPAVSYPFLCALARQCFNTQFAFFVANDELRRVTGIRKSLQAALKQSAVAPRKLERSMALAALYGSLHDLAGWERLLSPKLSQWSEPFQPIVREQLIDHRQEQDIAGQLTALTKIRNEVSRKVRRQYEENPYPRWITAQRPKAMTPGDLVRSLRPGEVMRGFSHPAAILVAGCGSGQHPIQMAMACTDCEILAVDLSRASLAYAARMAERFGVTNITFQQADILELDGLNRQFAIIACSGVLHHLKEPLEGWRRLVKLLAPDGVMKIGLYSSIARSGVQAAREIVRTRKFPATVEGVRKCRHAILNLPEGHPSRGVLTFNDFFSTSGCRDLIMHVQECTFTVPDLADCLEQLSLRFLGFQCDPHIQARFLALFPEKSALTDLASWDRFEEANPDTFHSMYQFWCCRK